MTDTEDDTKCGACGSTNWAEPDCDCCDGTGEIEDEEECPDCGGLGTIDDAAECLDCGHQAPLYRFSEPFTP